MFTVAGESAVNQRPPYQLTFSITHTTVTITANTSAALYVSGLADSTSSADQAPPQHSPPHHPTAETGWEVMLLCLHTSLSAG